ncbi:Crp/Fnr family transcriptional regulator [Sphingobacterium faecale]|uniref:Crp/Fnr family transcriptional regulator n=1 Tax=Sphingobacterium faecale TaxID=2803775 RepID=A0ABS1R993_9SPHI|nr:Crp/Fnr family transcriptional regulator [Sphingobacterium faecale]MBL1411233.1 Crp/Fnr family transcriptional regulator [Sphingobacterium faecale]
MQQDLSYQFLKGVLSRYKIPSEDLLEAILHKSRVKSYEDKEVLLRSGEIYTKIVLLQDGKAIALEKLQQKKHLDWIWSPTDFIIHASSLLQERISDVDIVFPVASTTLEIDLIDLFRIREQFPEINYYFNRFLAQKNSKLKKHIRWIKRTGAKERVAQFRDDHKDIYYVITDEQKASYLKMGLRWFQKNK